MAGIVGVVSGLYGGKKLANIDSKFALMSGQLSQLTGAVNTQTAIQVAGFSALIEVQTASLFAIRDVERGIHRVEGELSKISNVLQRQERREEMVGDLKLIVLSIKKALDHIDTIKEAYTPWATFETQILLDIVEEHDIRIQHFKRLPPTEIEYVQEILERLTKTHAECMLLLGGQT
tara:strand:+ start:185 stop:715 length:531 start_codon:yes stop_codon:yes gene_type:complete